MAAPILDRFLNKWEPVTESGCWVWTAGIDHFGYGKLADGNGGFVRAHRFAWSHYNGPIPEGLCVLHRCDNPHCCNPNHLFLGTRADNCIDKTKKGRAGRKLNKDSVIKIRADRRTHETIASDYGVSRTMVTHIKLGTHWRYI